MKKLTIKSLEHSYSIDNPIIIPQLYSKIVTPQINLGRVIDIEYNYIKEEVIVTIETFSE